jgi:hypothetical protein
MKDTQPHGTVPAREEPAETRMPKGGYPDQERQPPRRLIAGAHRSTAGRRCACRTGRRAGCGSVVEGMLVPMETWYPARV